MRDEDCGAGIYEMPIIGVPTQFLRAWRCTGCGASWFHGDKVCWKCQSTAVEPEPLPEGATIVVKPNAI